MGDYLYGYAGGEDARKELTDIFMRGGTEAMLAIEALLAMTSDNADDTLAERIARITENEMNDYYLEEYGTASAAHKGMKNELGEAANYLYNSFSSIREYLKGVAAEYLVETADDYGTQTGPFMSPELFREMIAPRRKKLNDFIRSKAPNAKIFHHTCGSVYLLLDDLIAAGVDVLNPVQPSAKDMQGEKLQPEFGSRIIFHGSVDEQTALVKPMEVLREKIAHQCATLGRDGGYIVAPTSNFQNDMPLENIVNFASIVHEFGTFEK